MYVVNIDYLDYYVQCLINKKFNTVVSAMFDIDAPCNAVELHLLCKVLDISGDKDIDYTMLHEGLYNVTYDTFIMLHRYITDEHLKVFVNYENSLYFSIAEFF